MNSNKALSHTSIPWMIFFTAIACKTSGDSSIQAESTVMQKVDQNNLDDSSFILNEDEAHTSKRFSQKAYDIEPKDLSKVPESKIYKFDFEIKPQILKYKNFYRLALLQEEGDAAIKLPSEGNRTDLELKKKVEQFIQPLTIDKDYRDIYFVSGQKKREYFLKEMDQYEKAEIEIAIYLMKLTDKELNTVYKSMLDRTSLVDERDSGNTYFLKGLAKGPLYSEVTFDEIMQNFNYAFYAWASQSKYLLTRGKNKVLKYKKLNTDSSSSSQKIKSKMTNSKGISKKELSGVGNSMLWNFFGQYAAINLKDSTENSFLALRRKRFHETNSPFRKKIREEIKGWSEEIYDKVLTEVFVIRNLAKLTSYYLGEK